MSASKRHDKDSETRVPDQRVGELAQINSEKKKSQEKHPREAAYLEK